ncbi:MAG: hypothetical protein ACFE91_01355 [Promethearchaeota archaeon]
MSKIKIKCIKCGNIMKLDFSSSVAVCKKCEKDEFWQVESGDRPKLDINE